MNNSKMFGHEKQLQTLINSFEKKFHHAWLISGDKGIGKNLLVKTFIDIQISSLDKTNLEKIKKSCLFEYNNDEKLTINEVRNIINEISLTNFSDTFYKYIIIDNIESLSINSKNALLKTLEEPPKNTVIFLISHDKQLLPKTIISRCFELRLQNLSKNNFIKFIKFKNSSLTDNEITKLFIYSNGSPGVYEHLLNNNFVLVDKIEDLIEDNKLNYIKLQKIIEFRPENNFLLLKFIKRFFYNYSKKNIIKNFQCKTVCKNTFIFFDSLKNNLDPALNVDINNEITLIFINFFKYIKSK